MLRRVVLSAMLGFLVLVTWTFVTNAIFGFTARVRLSEPPYSASLHSALKDAVVEPGAYMVNPPKTDSGTFPAGEPVFAVTYAGFGHEAAGRGMIIEMLIKLASVLLVATLLSLASPRVLARYGSRVAFVAIVGLFLALSGEMPHYGIGGYPLRTALLVAGYAFMSWLVAGVAIALPIRLPATPSGNLGK